MDIRQVTRTIAVIREQNFDAHIITIGISPLDHIDPDISKAADKTCKKVVKKADSLVAVGDKIAAGLGIPIVNKRVSVASVSIIGVATDTTDYLPLARVLDKTANETGIDFVDGFSALARKDYQKGDEILINFIPYALAEVLKACSSVSVGSAESGASMIVTADMGRIIRGVAELSDLDAAKLVVLANAVEDNPSMAGTFYGIGEADVVADVSVSGPGVVKHALEKIRGESFDVAAETVKKTTFRVIYVDQLVGQMASKRLGVRFGTVDLSLAPMPTVGDSIARVLEKMGFEAVGTHGTTAAPTLLDDQVKKGGIMAYNQVGGLFGTFIPVSEDEGAIAAVQGGSLNSEKLEAMTAVCSVGLDMIAISEDTSHGTIAAMIADEAAIDVINQKITAVRIIPEGKEGDTIGFGGLLGTAPAVSVNHNSSADFIKRGGQIPTPVHGFKN